MLDLKWIRENRKALEKMLSDRRSKLDVGPLYTLDANVMQFFISFWY